jgi:hypothetical protein
MKAKLLITTSLISVTFLFGQSFEQIYIPGITDVSTSSRSANFIDLNNDGWDDIFFSNGLSTGETNMLYLNNTDGTFTIVTDDDIVEHSIRAVGASFADVDNDGDLDGYVVTWGAGGQPKRNYFYRNNGEGSFQFEEEVAPNLTYSETASWIDINGDNLLDLYITNSAYSLRNLYFENQGDGSFLERTDLTITNEVKPSRSIDWVDYNGDGDDDLFITNEGNNTNTLYRNDGANQFTKITDLAIVQGNRNSMGSSWADVDNDGDFDLLVTNYEQANQLFINENGVFVEKTDSEIAAQIFNSFGSTFGDIDNDGDLDLLILNSYNDTHFRNSIFLNDGNGNFIPETNSTLANFEGWTYSAAFGDFNNDGWLDVILANNQDESQENALFKNTGTGKNWVKLKCIGNTSNKAAIGAKVKVKAQINGNLVTQLRKVEATSGYASQNSLTTHFGLGNANEILEVIVQWPSGLNETFAGISLNSEHILVEGNGMMEIGQSSHAEIKIYPNPVREYLFLESLNPLQIYQFKLIHMDGKILYSSEIQNSETHKIDLKSLPTGIYTYHILSQNEGIQQGKIIKK